MKTKVLLLLWVFALSALSIGCGDKTNKAVIEPVDMGLSVKWASFNLGAFSPEEYGDYYAWGELETKSDYSEEMYSYHDNPSVLPSDRDIAHAILGGQWRIPTREEFNELLDNCTSEWTTLNGHTGRLFTSSINGNSIFIPAAGIKYDTRFAGSGISGAYWTSSLEVDRPTGSYCFVVAEDSEWTFIGPNVREMGLLIRPVCE